MRGGDVCAVALGGGGALFGDEEGGAVVDGCGGLLVMRGGCGLYAFWCLGLDWTHQSHWRTCCLSQRLL